MFTLIFIKVDNWITFKLVRENIQTQLLQTKIMKGILLLGLIVLPFLSVQAQSTTHKSTSLGLFCKIVDNCTKCSGTGIQKTGGRKLALVTKECPKCKGVSNDMLYVKPCVECKNTRKIRELDVVDGEPIKTTTCSSCEGKGEITLYQFEVADVDFPRMNGSNSDGMNWFQATAACEALGNGWRLPTPIEFLAMYATLHDRGKGNFKSQYSYWSSKEHDVLHAYNYSFEFNKIYNGGPKDGGYKYVRAVRTIE